MEYRTGHLGYRNVKYDTMSGSSCETIKAATNAKYVLKSPLISGRETHAAYRVQGMFVNAHLDHYNTIAP